MFNHSDEDVTVNSPLQQPESLSKKVVKGGIWVFALRIVNRGLGLIRTIILARLLAPQDFGLLGIAMLAISTLETFSQTGFQIALIQKKDRVESYLDTAWTVSVIRGTLLFIILFFSAHSIAKFFDSSEAVLVIKVLAISNLISAFRNIGIVFFQKELEFNRQFALSLSTTLANLAISIPLAFLLRNVWALVWGSLMANFVGLILSYVLHPYRPRLSVKMQKCHELFGFGKWVVGSGILLFLITQGDDIFVAKVCGVTSLGLYQMAYMLSSLPATELTHVISQVTFPAYSKMQDNLSRLKQAYFDVLQLTAFFSLPLAGGIFVLAPDFTQIFLGDKWTLMVPALQVLAFWGMIRSLGATTGALFLATGRPDIPTKLQFTALLILIMLIFPFTFQWGILGTSLAVVFSTLLPNILAAYMIMKLLKSKSAIFLKKIYLSLLGTLFMIISILSLKYFLLPMKNIAFFFSLIIIGIFIYLIFTFICIKFFGEYKKIVHFMHQFNKNESKNNF